MALKRIACVLLMAAHVPSAASQPGPAADASVPPTEPLSDADATARGLFLTGQAAYAEGDYEVSIDRFNEAYKLTARPLLLFNLANSYERLAQYGAAADALARYLDDAPSDEQISLRKRIARLRTRALLQAQAQQREASAKLQLQQGLSVTAPVHHSSTKTWIAVGVAGGGVLVGVLATVALASAANARAQGKALCVAGLCPESTSGNFDRADRYTKLGAIGMGVSAVALSSSVYIWLHRDSGRTGPGLTPSKELANAQSIGLGIRHQF